MGCNTSKEVFSGNVDQPAGSQHTNGSCNASFSKKQFSKLSRRTRLKHETAIMRAEQLFDATKGQRFHDNYIRTTLVSYGASCKVLTAVHKATGKKYAAKAIPKDMSNPDKQYQDVLLEVGVMKEVEDHPNAVQLIEVYNDVKQYYMVMEYCEGGELFDHISKSLMGLTERQAAQILRAIMTFLSHMHSKGLAHMDVKPENIMFDSEGADGVLKIIDFGASVYVGRDEHVRDAFGTVRYSSPEMANDEMIGQKTDVWSAGVVMYLMLCGSPPFMKASDIDLLNYIKKAPRVKFSGNKWGLISPAAKDCIRAMLEPDPSKRPTAPEVLQLTWLRTQVPDNTIKSDIIQHLRAFANQSRMRRMLLGLVAKNLTGIEANRLLSQFYMVDQDSSGTIELPELIAAAKKVFPDISEDEVSRVFSALDVDDTGSVDVREFFASLLHTMDVEMQSALAAKSFADLDTGMEGVISLDVFVGGLVAQARAAGLLQALGEQEAKQEEQALRAELEAEFKALDVNNDGVLTFEEFKSALSVAVHHQQQHKQQQHQHVEGSLHSRPQHQSSSGSVPQQKRTPTGSMTGVVSSTSSTSTTTTSSQKQVQDVMVQRAAHAAGSTDHHHHHHHHHHGEMAGLDHAASEAAGGVAMHGAADPVRTSTGTILGSRLSVRTNQGVMDSTPVLSSSILAAAISSCAQAPDLLSPPSGAHIHDDGKADARAVNGYTKRPSSSLHQQLKQPTHDDNDASLQQQGELGTVPNGSTGMMIGQQAGSLLSGQAPYLDEDSRKRSDSGNNKQMTGTLAAVIDPVTASHENLIRLALEVQGRTRSERVSAGQSHTGHGALLHAQNQRPSSRASSFSRRLGAVLVGGGPGSSSKSPPVLSRCPSEMERNPWTNGSSRAPTNTGMNPIAVLPGNGVDGLVVNIADALLTSSQASPHLAQPSPVAHSLGSLPGSVPDSFSAVAQLLQRARTPSTLSALDQTMLRGNRIATPAGLVRHSSLQRTHGHGNTPTTAAAQAAAQAGVATARSSSPGVNGLVHQAAAGHTHHLSMDGVTLSATVPLHAAHPQASNENGSTLTGGIQNVCCVPLDAMADAHRAARGSRAEAYLVSDNQPAGPIPTNTTTSAQFMQDADTASLYAPAVFQNQPSALCLGVPPINVLQLAANRLSQDVLQQHTDEWTGLGIDRDSLSQAYAPALSPVASSFFADDRTIGGQSPTSTLHHVRTYKGGLGTRSSSQDLSGTSPQGGTPPNSMLFAKPDTRYQQPMLR